MCIEQLSKTGQKVKMKVKNETKLLAILIYSIAL